MALTRVVGQAARNQNAASATTITVTLNGITPGALLVLGVTVVDSVTVSTVRDDLVVDATKAAASSIDYVAHGQRFECWYFENHGGGSRTFTATFSAAATFRGIQVTEYAGAATSAAYFDGSTATGTSTTLNSGAKTPLVNGCLIWGQGHVDGSVPTPSGAFGSIDSEAGVNDVNWEDQIQGTAAAIAATWTFGSSLDWVATMAIFKPAVGATGPMFRGA